MNHARLLMVSAIASALAACGGGGGGDSTSNATSTSSANSSASATSNVTVNIDGLTMPAARQAVEQANESAAAAQQRLMEARAALAVERSREDAAARQQEIAAAQAEVQRLQDELASEKKKVDEAQEKLAAVVKRDEQQKPVAAPTTEILDCSRNAATVTDPETGLHLVCESQITTGATAADVGTEKHASGRYYAVPFPGTDTSMMFVGKKATYKLACSQRICEWLKVGGSMDIEYAAQGKHGTYYRFSSCRTGDANKVICAYPSTDRPDGIDRWFDNREPESPRIGAVITDTDTSGSNRFRPKAEVTAPIGCREKIGENYVLPWPGNALFKQVGENEWEALFDGGNCLGDVRVEVSGSLDTPKHVQYMASAQNWPITRAVGPDGTEMKWVPISRQYSKHPDDVRARQEMMRTNPELFYYSMYFLPGSTEQAADPAARTQTNSQAPANNGTTSTGNTAAPTGNVIDSAAAPNSAADSGSAASNGASTAGAGAAANVGPTGGNAANPPSPVTDAVAPGNTTPANGAAAPQENQNAQPTPDARTTEGGDATAGAAQGGPVTSAGMFQQQRNDGAADPGTRSEGDGAFPWNGNGSTVPYGGRQITTQQQPDGSIIYRTSTGEVPFDRALDANGNVLRSVADTCKDLPEGGQECTFRAAA